MTELTHFIINCLSVYYAIEATALVLLPVGADINASVYKVEAVDQKTYFVKLRRGHSHDVSIAILDLLQKSGIQQLILPIKTENGNQIAQFGDFTLIVYPFVQGQDGFSRPLTDEQWIALGVALRQVHEVDVPDDLRAHLRQEDFSPKARDFVRSLYTHTGPWPIRDEVALNFWEFLQKNRLVIQRVIDRLEQLGSKMRAQPLKFVLCHADIHGGNILVDDQDAFYIVDWDDPILAPKERDLMFIGGGVGNVWNKPHEEKLFYQGYGETNVDGTLLAHYRYERILVDIAEYSQELLFKPTEGKNRIEMYKQFTDCFAPNGVVDIAFKTDNS